MCAHSTPACGRTVSRPGNCPSSLRIAVPSTHAGALGARSAPRSFVSTIAKAPCDEGQDSWKWMGSHSIGDSFTFSIEMSFSWRWAYGFLHALRRSLTATFQPMCSGAPERAMYERIHGAKIPPAPMPPLRPPARPHCALPSACFSYATVSTRSCTPVSTRCVATNAVEPPTLPAVCTRIIGLPAPPSASAMLSSGIITPSNGSGALPSTTASMSRHVSSASSSARCAASRTSPGNDTSSRLFLCFVWPMPTIAHGRWLIASAPGVSRRAALSRGIPLEHAHEVLLETLARRRVRDRAAFSSLGDLARRLGDPCEPDGHHRVGRECATRRVDGDVVTETERVAKDPLLVAERGAELGDLDRAVADAGPLTRQAGRRRLREVAHAGLVRLDAMVDAPDPDGPVDQLARLLGGREHDRARAVGDRREVVATQRCGHVRLLEQHVDVVVPAHLRVRVADRLLAAPRRDLGHLALGDLAGVEHGARLKRGE